MNWWIMSDLNQIAVQRKKYLSPSFSLSYETPLHIVKGEAQYLYASNGDRYLDAVNNIQHVGHCHPVVVQAAQKQYEVLNTNTRYLDATIVNYAKALTNHLPKGLDVCYFTNSGSESNDLALRLARTATGSMETIVLDGAYHGHVSSLIEVSPYKHNAKGGTGPPDFVYTVPMPDTYRGKYRGNNAGREYLRELKNILEQLKKNNKKISAFIVEPIMGCGGQLILPKNFLKEAFDLVRNAGGICIADEVQIGFGRMGTNFWGFETENVVPDIVTMGKSMGNGHPLSAVVTTKKIADLFDQQVPYTTEDVIVMLVKVIGVANGKLIERSYQKSIFGENGMSAIQRSTASGVCANIVSYCRDELTGEGFIKQEDVDWKTFISNKFGQVYVE